MKLPRRVSHRMYAVSLEGVGIIAGTMAYSRRDALNHSFGGSTDPKEWEACKRGGYRTVQAKVEVTWTDRFYRELRKG